MAEQAPPKERLGDAEVERYSRQLLLPGVGEAGQLRLGRALTVVVGCGGLGGPAALFLAAAGVGRIRLADPDRVELDNLHRQVAFRTADIGRPKAELLAEELRRLNPLVLAETVVAEVGHGSVDGILEGADLVLECSDDPATKFLVNDRCVRQATALVVGGAIGFSGQLVVVASCREAGVIGPLVGVVGALQALEGMKLILGLVRPTTAGRLIDFEALSGRWRELPFPKAAACGIHQG